MTKDLLLKIENVSSGYGSTIIVNDFSFDVEKGQILAITGSNGMGKTTLMKTIMGLIRMAFNLGYLIMMAYLQYHLTMYVL